MQNPTVWSCLYPGSFKRAIARFLPASDIFELRFNGKVGLKKKTFNWFGARRCHQFLFKCLSMAS